MSPNARLEVFHSSGSGADLDLAVDGAASSSPTSPPTLSIDAKTVVIRATGAQLDRNLGSLDLSIDAERPAKCSHVNADGGVVRGPAGTPSEQHQIISNKPGKPQGFLQFTYKIQDYLRSVRCPFPGLGDTLSTPIKLVVTVTNVASRKTTTPIVLVQP